MTTKPQCLAVFQSSINRDPILHRRLLPKIHWVLTTKYKPGVVGMSVVIPELGRLKQEDCLEFKLGFYTARICLLKEQSKA